MRILLVEDDDLLGKGIKKSLTRDGYQVDWLMDGEMGLAALDTDKFDLVLLDLTLPGMGGLELLSALRSQHNQTPVLILTARDTLDDKIVGLDTGADDYLVKPFEKDKRYSFESNAIVYGQTYHKTHSINLALISLKNGYSFVQNNYKLAAYLLTDRIWYGSNILMNNLGISPKFTYIYKKDWILDTELKYSKKFMAQKDDRDKDAKIKSLTFTLTKKLKNNASMALKTYVTRNRKVRGARSDVSIDGKGFTLSYGREIIPTINSVFAYTYDRSNYLLNDTGLPSRRDGIDTYGLTLTKSIDKTSNISVDYSHVDAISNIESNTYDKQSMNLTYTKTF